MLFGPGLLRPIGHSKDNLTTGWYGAGGAMELFLQRREKNLWRVWSEEMPYACHHPGAWQARGTADSYDFASPVGPVRRGSRKNHPPPASRDPSRRNRSTPGDACRDPPLPRRFRPSAFEHRKRPAWCGHCFDNRQADTLQRPCAKSRLSGSLSTTRTIEK